MGLVRSQRQGEGMRIVGKGRNIDISILEVMGTIYRRKVRLGIKGVEGLDMLEISSEDGLCTLVNDIKIRVGNRKIWYKDRVYMDYNAPKDYCFERKEFK